MHLIKSGNKYYLSKIGTKNYLWDDDYIIENGQLKWCHPNIYLQNNAESDWTVAFTISNTFHKFEDKIIVIFKKISDFGGTTNQGPLYGGTDGDYAFSISRWYCTIDNKHGSSYTTADIKHTMILQNYEAYLNGNSLNLSEGSHAGVGGNLNYTNVFYSANGTLKGNIYSIKWERNNNLIYYLVPVPINLQIGSFTVPSNGMFDIVNQQFYPNQGSGTFTYGKDT